MIANVLRKIKISVDPRGYISCGHKRDDGRPESLDYFDVSDFPELQKMYGSKPNKLILFFPYNEIHLFFRDDYERWGKSKKAGSVGAKVRSCNGEQCFFHIDETVNEMAFHAGEESECVCKRLNKEDEEESKMMCKYRCSFVAWIANPNTGLPDNPQCYRFVTGSDNSSAYVYSELEKIKNWSRDGRITGIPFQLTVEMQTGKKANEKFPLMKMSVFATVSQVIEGAQGFTLPKQLNDGKDLAEAVYGSGEPEKQPVRTKKESLPEPKKEKPPEVFLAPEQHSLNNLQKFKDEMKKKKSKTQMNLWWTTVVAEARDGGALLKKDYDALLEEARALNLPTVAPNEKKQ